MQLTRTLNDGIETITFPIKRWNDYSNPTLEFMLNQGFEEVIPEPPVPLTEEEISTNLADLKLQLISYTKAVAYRLIVALIPEWKQRNYSARAIELQEIRHEVGSLSPDEAAELLGIRGIFSNEVKPIRAASDVIEEEISAGAITTEAQIDNHIAWEI